jgi:hypothetical protein
MSWLSTKSKSRLPAAVLAGVIVLAPFGIVAFPGSAVAADHRDDGHRDGGHRDGGWHRGGGGYHGGGYRGAPPVVYGSQYYAPPVAYGSPFGLNIHIR